MKIQSIVLLCSGAAMALVLRMPWASPEPQLGYTKTLSGGPLTGAGGAAASPTAASAALSGAAPGFTGVASGGISPSSAAGHLSGSGPDNAQGRVGGVASATTAEGCVGGGAVDQAFTACGPYAAPTTPPGK